MPERSTATRMASPPSAVAASDEREPPSLPTGVRTAATTTVSGTSERLLKRRGGITRRFDLCTLRHFDGRAFGRNKKRGRCWQRPCLHFPRRRSRKSPHFLPCPGRYSGGGARLISAEPARTVPAGWVHSKGSIAVLPPTSQRAFAITDELVPRFGILIRSPKCPSQRSLQGPSIAASPDEASATLGADAA